MKLRLDWRNLRNFTLALTAILLFVANIPQGAYYQGDSITQSYIGRVTHQTDDMNTFLAQLGIGYGRLCARSDFTGDMTNWRTVMQKTTFEREYVKYTDWDEPVFTDAMGNPHNDRRGGLEITQVINTTVGYITYDDIIIWANPYFDFELTSGYRKEHVYSFRYRLTLYFGYKADNFKVGSTGLDGYAQYVLKLLRSEFSNPYRQEVSRTLLRTFNTFFYFHPTETLYKVYARDGELYVRGANRDRTLTTGFFQGEPNLYVTKPRGELVRWMSRYGMAQVDEETWTAFLARICEESGCSVPNPDEMIAVVNSPGQEGVYEMLRGATQGLNNYGYIDRYTHETFRALFGNLDGLNDDWLPSYYVGDANESTCNENMPLLWNYHLLWVGSDTHTYREPYAPLSLTRYESDLLAEWIRDGGTMILGAQDSNAQETWFPSYSYGQVYPISDWFEFTYGNDWVDLYTNSKYSRVMTSQSYIGDGMKWSYDGVGSTASFGASLDLLDEPVNAAFYPNFKFYYRSTIEDVVVRFTLVSRDASYGSGWQNLMDAFMHLEYTLPSTGGEWNCTTLNMIDMAEEVTTPWEVHQLTRLQIEYTGSTIGGGKFFEIDEISCTTGAESGREIYFDAYGRGAPYGFGDDFEVCRWADLAGVDGYRRWDAAIGNGTAAFHVYAAAPPGAPELQGPFPESYASTWWEIDRGATWIQYLNTTFPRQKRYDFGLDMTNLGTPDEPVWVQDHEHPPQYVIETTDHNLLRFT
ncbi:MAG: hypothetical protein ACFFCO_09135, partial [Promethearchaeota archaeon]